MLSLLLFYLKIFTNINNNMSDPLADFVQTSLNFIGSGFINGKQI
jgi:hypothetical protein